MNLKNWLVVFSVLANFSASADITYLSINRLKGILSLAKETYKYVPPESFQDEISKEDQERSIRIIRELYGTKDETTELEPSIVAYSEQIQLHYLGAISFKLGTCNGCGGLIQSSSLTAYLDYTEEWKDFLPLIYGHEISHYIYEAAVQNGVIHSSEVTACTIAEKYNDADIEPTKKDKILEWGLAMGQCHSMQDTMSLIIMKELNQPKPVIDASFFNKLRDLNRKFYSRKSQSNQLSAYLGEIDERERIFKSVMLELWK